MPRTPLRDPARERGRNVGGCGADPGGEGHPDGRMDVTDCCGRAPSSERCAQSESLARVHPTFSSNTNMHMYMLYMWTNPGPGHNPGYKADLGTSFLALSHCERVLLNPASSCRRFCRLSLCGAINQSKHPSARTEVTGPPKAKAMAKGKAHTLTEVRTHSRNRHHQPSDQPSEATGQHRTQGQTDAHHDHDSPEG